MLYKKKIEIFEFIQGENFENKISFKKMQSIW